MSKLTIYTGDGSSEVLTDHARIADRFDSVGLLFERWAVNPALDPEASQDEIIEAYREEVDRLMQHYGFQSLDVISMHPEHPRRIELRERYRREHTHSDFEMRFFVEGEALFYLRKRDVVYGLRCTPGDLLSVPADTAHWFDMGLQPNFKAIRLFSGNGASRASYTGSAISDRFPCLDEAAGRLNGSTPASRTPDPRSPGSAD